MGAREVSHEPPPLRGAAAAAGLRPLQVGHVPDTRPDNGAGSVGRAGNFLMAWALGVCVHAHVCVQGVCTERVWVSEMFACVCEGAGVHVATVSARCTVCAWGGGAGRVPGGCERQAVCVHAACACFAALRSCSLPEILIVGRELLSGLAESWVGAGCGILCCRHVRGSGERGHYGAGAIQCPWGPA